MFKTNRMFFNFLKIGAIVNIYLLLQTFKHPIVNLDKSILLSAQIFLFTAAFRCLFPNRYTNNVVYYDSFVSSIFLTRFFATFSEIAYIYLFSAIIRIVNSESILFIDVLSWLMVAQVIVSQFCVWGAIFIRRFILYFYEEVGWLIIYFINTLCSIYLYFAMDTSYHILLLLNIIFGLIYLPWQFVHLKSLFLEAYKSKNTVRYINLELIKDNFKSALYLRNQSSDLALWGGSIGVSWMLGYWVVISLWIYFIIKTIVV